MQFESKRFSEGNVSPLRNASWILASASLADLKKQNMLHFLFIYTEQTRSNY